MNKVDIKVLCEIAKLAGEKILEVYSLDNLFLSIQNYLNSLNQAFFLL